MDDVKIKQQIVEKLKASDHILVTVSDSPSVDALSAALGLSLVIHKLGKHATTIFSGSTPPAIDFLEPGKSFEENADSLRDFIIAISKDKADHIRMKVDGDMAKIYITPYHTTITQADLQFEDGDYGVELVVALGVDNKDHLDRALSEHGKIFHDATIVSITTGETTGDLGGINWNSKNSSSLSEMIVTLAEALKDKERLIDKNSATALLTGIVAETDRFSNPKTTSSSLTVAAQLMSDGADQQLIASELEKSHEVGSGVETTSSSTEPESSSAYGSSLDLSDDKKEAMEEVISQARAQAETIDTSGDDALKAVEETASESSVPTSAYGMDDEEEHPIDAVSEVDPEDQPAGAPMTSAYAMEDDTPIEATADSAESHKVIEPIHDDIATATNEVASEMTDALNQTAPIAPTAEPAPATPPTVPTPADLGLPMPPSVPTDPVAPPVETPAQTPPPVDLAPSVPVPPPASPPLSPPGPSPEPSDATQFKIPGSS